jgi:hypothetical protein
MTTSNLLQRLLPSLAMACCILSAEAAAAAASDVRVLDQPAEQRVLVNVASLTAGAAVTRVAILPRAGMIHRLSVELYDGAGTPWAGAWTVAVGAAPAGVQSPQIGLGHLRRQLELPRPLGIAVAAGDSMLLRIRIDGDGGQPLELRIVLDYEAQSALASRIAVVPVRVEAIAASAETTAGWEWRVPVDGRVMAVTGLVVAHAAELVLLDVEAGTVIWRETVQPQTGEAFGGKADVVRVGVLLKSDRLYRLMLVTGAGEDVSESGGIHAMVAVAAAPTLARVRE